MSELAIAHLTAVDPIMGGLIRAAGAYAPQIDLECHPFQALAQAIAHQQLNGTAARTILGRFVAAAGKDGAFPTPHGVLAAPDATLRACGFSFAKIASLRDLATKTTEGVVPDHATLHALGDAEIIERLTEVRGIGRWTVEMMLMFRLGRPDILPVDDFGVRNGFRLTYGLRQMPAPLVLAAYGERWGPHRSVAAWYLWRAVEMARAGTLPKPSERVQLPRIRRKRRKAKASRKTRRLRRAKASGRKTAARRTATRGTSKRRRPSARAKTVRKARSKRARK
jgi:DNA-3-methyladenine glycosylase II